MGNLLAPFLRQLGLSIVVFVILFIVIGVVLARGRFAGMVVGLLRVVGSYFYSPFLYLRKGIGELADYAREGERRFEHTDQYLLRKVLLMLTGALLLVSIGILTIGGVGAWNHAKAWIERSGQARKVTVRIVGEQAEKARLVTFVAGLDDQWQNGRQPLIAAYQRTRERLADSLRTANRGLAGQIERIGNTESEAARLFPNLVQYLQSSEENPAGYLDFVRNRAHEVTDNLSVSDTCKALLNRYVENWYLERMTLEDVARMDDEALRRVLQPTRGDSTARIAELEEVIPQDSTRQRELRTDARREAKGVVSAPLRAFLRFLLVAWAAGVAIEALALAVLTAAHIQRLREKTDEAGADTPRD